MVASAGIRRSSGMEFWVGIGVLIGSPILFPYRRIVQDTQAVSWSEDPKRPPIRRGSPS